MNKKGILIISGIILMGILLFSNRTKKIDWSPNYEEDNTLPMGTKVFFEQLPTWFKDQKIKKLHTTFYEYEKELITEEHNIPHNYISISGNYTIDKPSFESLLKYVGNGNQAFITAHTFPKFMKDTLGFEVDYNPVTLLEPKQTAYLLHLKDSLTFTQKQPYGEGFIKDTTHIKRLGYFYSETSEEQSNFIGIPFGKGIFYLHTSPEIFTNYQILASKNNSYLNSVVSYLPINPILFEKNIKIDPDLNKGPLSFIFAKPALKWAWYLLLVTIGLFLIFNAKRRQRIIPIIEPLKNTTTEFVQTVSTLHYEAEDYNGIIQKTIIYFLENIRSNYLLPTHKLDTNFIKKLAQKSGKPEQEIQTLVTMIINMKSHKFTTKEPLIRLNKEIEKFNTKNS